MKESHRKLFDEYMPRIMQCRLGDLVLQTPVQEMPALSERLGVQVVVKREDLQPVFSFKLRGAYAKLRTLSAEQRQQGIICASAGNHAQGVAMAARHLGIDTIVVMPAITPEIKVNAVEKLGASIVIHGDTSKGINSHQVFLLILYVASSSFNSSLLNFDRGCILLQQSFNFFEEKELSL